MLSEDVVIILNLVLHIFDQSLRIVILDLANKFEAFYLVRLFEYFIDSVFDGNRFTIKSQLSIVDGSLNRTNPSLKFLKKDIVLFYLVLLNLIQSFLIHVVVNDIF